VLRLGESSPSCDKLDTADLAGDARYKVGDPTFATGLLKFSDEEGTMVLTGLFNCSLLGWSAPVLSDGDGLKSDLSRAFGVILRGEVSQLPAT